MSRSAILAALSLGLATAACTPITAYSGFQAIEASPSEIKAGEDTRSTVLERLGSPSATATFDQNTWFYISQSTDRVAFYRPRVATRSVVAVRFDPVNEKVLKVETYGLKDGRVFAYNSRETPTRGRELTILEQLLGNVGRGGLLPQDQDRTPGSRPDDQ